MSSHYYFLASLPMLRFPQKPPIKGTAFLEDCLRLSSMEDYNRVARARILQPSLAGDDSVFGFYQQSEFELRNELARIRGKRTGRDSEAYLRKDAINPAWVGRLREVLEEASPHKAEVLFSQILWSILDELLVGHHFDTASLVIYYLKLQILERIALFDLEIGKQKLESILNGVTQHGN